ncbi:hypothetical protein [Faecalibacterium sp. I4-1-79]|uniref:hypothetical protein n=1 Tax=Faecalibacterium sp. I4-1-79 TaxID=2929494 RepID=UPI002015000A|nr:hypothetical protein [Faecalibacterium sp. I4-1-79]UQK40084.1 hypothetical protein MTP36_15040 [Faecalibacterium sp. I4-1-79]
MKKWLIWCLTVLAMVCLIPGIVLKAAAETVPVHCSRCGSRETREILGYRKYDSTYHRVYVTECQNCHNDGNVTLLQVHTGGTQGPTCTEGKICEDCGAEYDIPGHAWGEWKPNGNGTHTRRCTNPNCDAKEENAPCGGDPSATCISPGTCTTCKGRYDGDHKWINPANSSLGNGTHRIICLRCGLQGTASCTGGTATCTTKAVCEVCKVEYGEKDPNNHALERRAAKAPTCTKPGWNAYEGCTRRGCGYTTYRAIPALKHDLVQHEAQAPTCTEKGWNAYETCSRCNYTTYAELPALNHALVQHAAKAPTCTEIGWNAYDTCSRCDYTTYTELTALNHDLVNHDAKAPTCTEKGWNAYETCSRCDYTTYAELPALNHDYQAVTVEPTCETDGYTVFTCSRCKDSYTADPTDKLGHQFGAWSPNGTGSQSADCLRQGCAHTGSTDCRKFTFRTAEGETLTFCPVCGQAENAAQLEMIDAATAWPLIGSLSAEDVTARTNGEYLSVAFETAGSLTQPTGRVRLALPAGLLEGKTLVRIAPDGTQTEMPFETKRGKIILTLDFVNSELPVMLFRLVPQTAAL